MNKKKMAWILLGLSLVGLGVFALLFAQGVSQLHWGRILVYFTLALVSVETAFFSGKYLFREKRKKA